MRARSAARPSSPARSRAASRASRSACEDAIYLGNLEAKRDWGHARDYVEGMHAILQADAPDDFVLATGETRSVREFVELAFAEVGRSIEWRGKGVEETGVDKKTGKAVVRIDPAYFRPTEVDLLIGDASKARQKLGWKPKTSFAQLVKEMVAGDLDESPGRRPPMASTPFELKGKTVFVAGHRGMVGSALVRRLAQRGCRAPDGRARANSTCAIRRRCSTGLRARSPQVVFLAAAKVGGIVANNTLRGGIPLRQSGDRGQRHPGGARATAPRS